MTTTSRLWGAILLIAGTTIGAGMLALPVTTGLAGFVPSLVLLTFVWLFMMLTAFYFLEVNLRTKGTSNLISMMHGTLGKGGEIASWVTYLLLLYSLLAAYIVGCGQLLADCFCPLLNIDLPQWFFTLFVIALFAGIVYFGTKVADLLNRFLMLALLGSYLLLIGGGFSHVKLSYLSHIDFPSLLGATSVVMTSFGYHIIIPTLTTYLHHDAQALKKAIFWGSLLPFAVYILFEALAMGVIPVEGAISLRHAEAEGMQVTFYLKELIGNPYIALAARLFALFAIVTSLLGVSLSLSDFLADALKIKKTHLGNISLLFLTFAPPLFFALFYPRGFITALRYAGILVVILLAILPLLMTWAERYKGGSKAPSSFRVKGGKPLLLVALALSLILLVIEVVR